MRVFPFCSLNCFVSLEEQKLLLQGQDLGQTLGTHSPQVGKQSLTESEFFWPGSHGQGQGPKNPGARWLIVRVPNVYENGRNKYKGTYHIFNGK